MQGNKIFGAMSAIITPFKNDKIDFNSYERIIKRQIKFGMNACVPVGTTGESATLSHKEHMECIEAAVSICKGSSMKVLAGAGSNSTKEAIELAQFAQKAGANAILCVSPYYNKPTKEGLYQHFLAIANSIEIPVMLYNIPGRTNINLDIDMIKQLYDVNNNIYAIKEASGNIERIVELNAKIPQMKVLSGEDAINYPILATGGCGVISVTGNLLPDKIVDLVSSALNKDYDKALAINSELFKINKILFCETSPIPIKTAMFLSGLIDTLEFRLPLIHMAKENLFFLEETLKQYEVKI